MKHYLCLVLVVMAVLSLLGAIVFFVLSFIPNDFSQEQITQNAILKYLNQVILVLSVGFLYLGEPNESK
jgi:hypothetical protein